MSLDLRYDPKSAQSKIDADLQFVTFRLDAQEYALNIAHVVQVVRMVSLTKPPKAPAYVEGVINLRGAVIPVIDFRRRCGLPAKAHDLNTQLLIVRAQSHTLALMVDVVSEVLAISAAHIESPERVGVAMEYLQAVAKLGDRLILIVDPSSLLGEGALSVAPDTMR